MQDQQPRRQLPLGVVAGFSALILATGGGVAWWTWASHQAQTSSTPDAVQPSSQETTSPLPNGSDSANTQKPSPLPATDSKTLQVYWLKSSGDRIALAPSSVQFSSSTGPNALLESALNQLLAGPTTTTDATTIPSGTKLRTVSVKSDGIHVDLSQEFTSGGGSTSMTGRVAQVLYTTTSLNPNANVWLSVEGKPIETLGGEGLVLEQPMTRERFKQDFPL